MARPRRTTPTRRYHLTVSAEFGDRLDAYASGLRQRPATLAAGLLEDALERAASGQQEDAPESETLAEARRHIEELNHRLSILRTQHAKCRPTPGSSSTSVLEGSGPRWEWPLPALLSDDEWWDRWLPRLYELFGRQLVQYAPTPGQVLDRRGYADLMTFLFPPILRGTANVTWRSPNYGELAGLEEATVVAAGPARAQVWEPVIRHLTEALCALEATGKPNADPYLRIRTKAEIVNSWADILRNLLGETAPTLPRDKLG
jgi:hypothetical protein